MRTSSTLLCFLALLGGGFGCQGEGGGGIGLTVQGDWPEALVRSETRRRQLFQSWSRTEIEVHDEKGRERRFSYPPAKDLRTRVLGRLEFQSAGSYDIKVRIFFGMEPIWEGEKKVKLKETEGRITVRLAERGAQ